MVSPSKFSIFELTNLSYMYIIYVNNTLLSCSDPLLERRLLTYYTSHESFLKLIEPFTVRKTLKLIYIYCSTTIFHTCVYYVIYHTHSPLFCRQLRKEYIVTELYIGHLLYN